MRHTNWSGAGSSASTRRPIYEPAVELIPLLSQQSDRLAMAATISTTCKSSLFHLRGEDPIAEDQNDEPRLSTGRTPGRQASELTAAGLPADGRTDCGGGLSGKRLTTPAAVLSNCLWLTAGANWSGFHRRTRLPCGASGRQPSELSLRDLTRLSEVQLTPDHRCSGNRGQAVYGVRMPMTGRSDSSNRGFYARDH